MPRGKKSITKAARALSNVIAKPKKHNVSRNEAARMKALQKLGYTDYRISKIVGRSRVTIAKYLQSEIFTDPQFEKKVEQIKEKEMLDLYSLGGKARMHLHNMIEQGSLTPLESIALMDRSFQQRRLLEGKSTENIASLTRIIEAAHADTATPLPEADRKMKNADQYTEAEIVEGEET
jgi:hypothetical protein